MMEVAEKNFSGELPNLKFDERGLIPAVVQDENGKVLMLAYMNAESLKWTLETGETWFYSRSREELWHKGATSGHIQKVLSIDYDCDGDTLLIKVNQTGVACHTGSYSCFDGRRIYPPQTAESANVPAPVANSLVGVINELYGVIKDRQLHPVDGSYTNYLFTNGQDKILKKVAEEAAETIIASKNGEKSEIIYEMGDLIYHCLVLLAYHGLDPNALLDELASRRHGGNYHKFTGKSGVRPND